MKSRVLLVGSGRRIKNNFIPALSCLSDYEIVGVHSRNPANIDAVSRRWNIPAVPDLRSFDFSKVDLIAISTTTSAVPSVLKSLVKPETAHLAVVIDTPVFEGVRHFKYLKLFSNFKKVLVAEDYMNFPQFELIRSVIAEGKIGEVKHVNLFHNGYRHHAIALIRSMLNFRFASFTSKVGVGGGDSIVTFSFGGGVRGVVTEPYQPHAGYIAVTGTKGTIHDFPPDPKKGISGYNLRQLRTNDRLDGFEIVSENYTKSYRPAHLPKLYAFDFDDKSEFNLLKTCGLIRVFDCLKEENINTRYGVVHGVYDSLMGRGARRAPFIVDPFGGCIVTALKLLA